MERLQTEPFELSDERVAWEGLAASCSPPLRRLGAFILVGFTAFIALTSATVLAYNVFGEKAVEGQGVLVPHAAFYTTMIVSVVIVVLGYAAWLLKSLRSYNAFAKMLRRGGLDPERPTSGGLRAYSDEQLLALRSRYDSLKKADIRELFEATFGFSDDDSFFLGPLSILPRTFEMDALRVEWETNLLLAPEGSQPAISWWREARHALLPRQTNRLRRLLYARRYTQASVRELKRRYGYRVDHWHQTVPEGKLWDAVRDHEDARRIEATLNRKPRGA